MQAFAVATAASALIFVAVFAVLSWLAGVGLGWLTALAGSVKIINWLTVPTAAANLVNVFGSLFIRSTSTRCSTSPGSRHRDHRDLTLPLLWWRFRHTDREALMGIALAMVVVVLFVPPRCRGTTPGRWRWWRRWPRPGRRSR